jgi:endo-1,4-beta-xylanase
MVGMLVVQGVSVSKSAADQTRRKFLKGAFTAAGAMAIAPVLVQDGLGAARSADRPHQGGPKPLKADVNSPTNPEGGVFFDGALGADGKAFMDKARQQIEKVRKGDFTVHVVGPDGKPVAGHAQVKLLWHEFKWGGLLAGAGFPGSDTPAQSKALGVMDELFSLVGVANNWKTVEPVRGGALHWEQTDKGVGWAKEHGKSMRIHCLIYDFQPEIPVWCNQIKSEQEWWPLIENHIRAVAERYGDVVNEYNVINEMIMHKDWEPTHNPAFPALSNPVNSARILGLARKYLPHATLVSLEQNYTTPSPENAPFREVLAFQKKLLELGAPVDVIGNQGHFFAGWGAKDDMPFYVGHKTGGPGAFSMKQIGEGLDMLAALGKPIHITEFHPPSRNANRPDPQPYLTPEETAAWLSNYMTLVFSKPYIHELIYYNIIDGFAGAAIDGGLVTRDGTLKPTYYAMRKLLKEDWSTRWDGELSAGSSAFRGFYGRYEVAVDGYQPSQFSIGANDPHTIKVSLKTR